MLQIVSGKFFKSDKCHETLHRGIYFTNYRSLSNAAFATPLGRLHPSTDRYTSVGTFTYELLERIESESRAPGTLTSTGGRELVESVADVLSFSLRAIWSVDIDVVRRLAPDNSSGPDRPLPQSALRRNFDHRVMSQPEDEALINAFLSELIGLERVSYEAAIRAIRRYVTATHRIADDTNLAYALFVMSIEALAQSAQAPQTTWEDYDETKRGRIDDALHGVPAELAMRVRAAVLRNEHIALGRRFRAFAIEHLSPQFFREEAEAAVAPISRADLDTMLKRAYEIRSGYVHRLQDLPKVLARPIGYVETIEVDGQATLTFEGLARLARHIIFQFVQRGHKVERENFHWRGALPKRHNPAPRFAILDRPRRSLCGG
jgi:hypothetical protein